MKAKLIMASLLLSCSTLAVAQTTIHLKFASVSEAQKLITAEDHYTRGLSQFDIDSRVGKAGATMAELKALQQQECREWTQAEIDTITKSFKLIEEKLQKNKWTIPVPAEVVMIKTTMHEEGDAGAYTREHQIYMGESALQPRKGRNGEVRPAPSAASLCSLMAHELFHVLTRNNLKFKTEMYKTIHFTRLENEIVFPKDVMDLRISNPDVSCYDSFAALTINGKKENVTMINVANKAYEGGSFFRYLQIGFIPLDASNKPVQVNGKTVIYDMKDAVDFYDTVGQNTGYVINPEECLADNFALAVDGFKPTPRMQQLPNPEIITAIQQVLTMGW